MIFLFAAHRGQAADELQQVHVPIRTDEECKEAYENHKYKINEDIMFCAGYKEGGRDTCQGLFSKTVLSFCIWNLNLASQSF